jgi:SAM-dependent methyltransferase
VKGLAVPTGELLLGADDDHGEEPAAMASPDAHAETLRVNRANWDARARLHGQDLYYDTEGLVGGASSLSDIEDDAVGDVRGLDLCHLQCHIGFDSISLARRGARVTGIDFSPVALGKAADLARRCGVELALVEADACDPPVDLHHRFDVVYATIGVLCWIDSVERWMGAVASLLRPGGTLVLVELHPLELMIDTVDPLVVDFPYNYDGPRRFDTDGSYADPEARIGATATIQFAHGIGEVVTAAIAAGLVITRLTEYTDSPRDYRGDLRHPESDRRYRRRLGGEAIPMLYTLLATLGR